MLTQAPAPEVRGGARARLRLLAAGPRALPRQHLPAARRVGAAFRLIPFEIKSLESLGVPPAVSNFASLPRGFVLVTGPTGSGKSTTLAALVDLANRTRHDHIMTVEDPIEFLHRHKACIVNQREVGEDTWSLRQRPQARAAPGPRHHPRRRDARPRDDLGRPDRRRDRSPRVRHPAHAGRRADRSTASSTSSRRTSSSRCASSSRCRCRASSARPCASTADGHGRVVATEVLVVTPAVRNLIREGKTHQIYSVMQAGAQFGMHTLDQHLAELVRTRRITLRDRRGEVPPHRGLQPARRPGLTGYERQRRHGSHSDLRVRGPRPQRQGRHRQDRGRVSPAQVAVEAQEHGLRPAQDRRGQQQGRLKHGDQRCPSSAARSSSRRSRSSAGSSPR